MTTTKTNQSFAAIMALGLMLAVLGSAAARPRVLPVTKATSAATQDPDIHIVKGAGLQFELPKGWKVETQENGNVFVTFEEGAGSVTFVIENDYQATVIGMKSGLKEQLTELKSEGAPKEDTHNGMTHRGESGSGMMKGVKITWSIDVLKATKYVTVLTFAVDSVMEAHAAEYLKFVESIKQI